jgi:hypothetical protein
MNLTASRQLRATGMPFSWPLMDGQRPAIHSGEFLFRRGHSFGSARAIPSFLSDSSVRQYPQCRSKDGCSMFPAKFGSFRRCVRTRHPAQPAPRHWLIRPAPPHQFPFPNPKQKGGPSKPRRQIPCIFRLLFWGLLLLHNHAKCGRRTGCHRCSSSRSVWVGFRPIGHLRGGREGVHPGA